MTPPKREDGTRSAVNLGSESSTRFSFRGGTTRCSEPAVVWDPRRQACEEVAGGLGGGGRSRGHLGKEGSQECRAGFPYASGQPVDGLERFIVAHRLLSQGV